MRYRNLRRYVALVLVILGGLWLFGPREPASLSLPNFDIAAPSGLDAYLATREAVFDDIVPGTEKSIVWAGKPGETTDLAIVYIHGFSASAMEIRPVPDEIAKTLEANLYFTRLRGHGRGSQAMRTVSVKGWMHDVGEALAIGRALGRKIIVMATSTGGTLAAAAALDHEAMQDVAGIIFISPNFGLQNPAARLLTLPFARHWVPLLAGEMRESTPRNRLHEKFWTTRYPTIALLPMAAIVAAVDKADFSSVNKPALFYFSQDDKVVRAEKTEAFAKRWGGSVRIVNPVLTGDDDRLAHLIAGNIVSPDQNSFAVQKILTWIKQL